MSSYQHRKTSAVLHVTNKEQQPIKDHEFTIRLLKHEFLFGCGAFDAMGIDATGEQKNAFNTRMPLWNEVYNFGTLPFYWGLFEKEEGQPGTELMMHAAKYLTDHNKTVKGHPLCWHTVCADWLLKYDNKTILDKQLDRIHRDVTAFKGTVDMWDVINEVVIMPDFDKYDNAITRICNAYGRVNLVKEVFDAAKAANPDATLLINDFNLSNKYVTLIDECLNAGVQIDAIGLQTHQHQGYMGREKLDEILKRFESFGLPLHFTENTLVSGHIMPADIVDLNDYQIPSWPTTEEGEARQKAEMEDMYRFLFDHPLVEAITGWDFTDGAWLGAPSGVVRLDHTTKPSYDMLKHLIHEEWSTTLKVKTDANGDVDISGFKGTYEIVASNLKAQFTLSKDSNHIHVEI